MLVVVVTGSDVECEDLEDQCETGVGETSR